MKLSCQEQLIPGTSFSEKVAWLAANDFAGIEIWGFSIAERKREIRECLADSPIRLSAMCAGYQGQLYSADPATVEQAISDICELVKHCADLDCPGLIVVPSFGTSRLPGILDPHPPTQAQEIVTFAAALREIGQSAAEQGVQIYVEAINRYESHVLNKLEDLAAAIELADMPSLRILADTFHMTIEESSVCGALAQHISHIGHIHLCDNNRLIPSKGHIPFGDILHTLREVGYTGYLSFECFLREKDDLLRAAAYIRKFL